MLRSDRKDVNLELQLLFIVLLCVGSREAFADNGDTGQESLQGDSAEDDAVYQAGGLEEEEPWEDDPVPDLEDPNFFEEEWIAESGGENEEEQDWDDPGQTLEWDRQQNLSAQITEPTPGEVLWTIHDKADVEFRVELHGGFMDYRDRTWRIDADMFIYFDGVECSRQVASLAVAIITIFGCRPTLERIEGKTYRHRQPYAVKVVLVDGGETLLEESSTFDLEKMEGAVKALWQWQHGARAAGACAVRRVLVQQLDGTAFGMGRQLYFAARALWFAHGTGRTLVSKSIDKWNYAGACAHGWTCLLAPLSACREEERWAVVALPLSDATQHASDVVYVADLPRLGPFCDSYRVSGAHLLASWAMQGAVPPRFAPRGPCWWMAQLTASLVAPNPRVRRHIASVRRAVQDEGEPDVERGVAGRVCSAVCTLLAAARPDLALSPHPVLGFSKPLIDRADMELAGLDAAAQYNYPASKTPPAVRERGVFN